MANNYIKKSQRGILTVQVCDSDGLVLDQVDIMREADIHSFLTVAVVWSVIVNAIRKDKLARPEVYAEKADDLE